jgi:two-component system response regulator MprA
MDVATPSRSGEAPHRIPPILVVDDVAAHRAETAATLAADGYPTEAAADGDAVLRLVRARLVRLVVAELYVPCAQGRCVVTCVKQERGRLPHLRVLVRTRHTRQEDWEWALDAGCDGLVPKSAPAAILLREVRRLDTLEPPDAAPTSDLGVARDARPLGGTERRMGWGLEDGFAQAREPEREP